MVFVDLVCACVIEIFPLEVDFCSAKHLGQTLGVIQRVGTADIFTEVVLKFLLEIGIFFQGHIGIF